MIENIYMAFNREFRASSCLALNSDAAIFDFKCAQPLCEIRLGNCNSERRLKNFGIFSP
jgi:hypothetical protein